MRNGARVRFFTAVDLVNQLEAEARAGKPGRLADQLVRGDLVILDELGYLPFPISGGQMLFHLISRLRRRWRRSGDGWPAMTTAIASSSIS